MSSVFAGAIVLLTLLLFTPLLYHLPQAVLAAIIMSAVVNLVNFRRCCMPGKRTGTTASPPW
jgi:sulfate permease, SulP family